MSMITEAIRIDTRAHARKTLREEVVMEVPINIWVNDQYVITLLTTPELEKELALGWLFDEGVLRSLDEVEKVIVNQNNVKVMTGYPIEKERMQAVGVTRILTTACGLSTSTFMKVIRETGKKLIKSNYKVRADDIIMMIQELDKKSTLGSTHRAALFENEKLAAFAEDIGRHSAIDKAIGIAIQSKVDFSKCVLTSSGRQPADMVLKAARIRIPILASIAGPIYSGIVAAKKTGVTLVCFVREQRMNVYTYPNRILD